MKKSSSLRWVRLALGGAIAGVSVAGLVSGGTGAEVLGATIGGLSSALLIKVLHLA